MNRAPCDIEYVPFDPALAEHRALARALGERAPRLAAVLTRCERVFALRSPCAPGLAFFGAEAPLVPSSAQRVASSGAGLTALDALTSCLGELVERASQYERADDTARRAPLAALEEGALPPAAVPHLSGDLARAGLGEADPIDWIAARALDGRDALLPLDWCVRRSAAGAIARPEGTALSSGLAAGPTAAAAIESALLELAERDAAALWWRGGVPARPVPPALEALGRDLVVQLRGDAAARTTWFLDLTSDLGIPVIAALSAEKSGNGLACGTAARAAYPAALRAALLELCALELGLAIARLREAAGAVNDSDRRHLARADLAVASCPLLAPTGEPSHGQDIAGPVAAILAARGVEAAIADLTRPELGVPVVMAIAPALQLMPGGPLTERLSKACAANNAAARWTDPVALY